MSINSTPKKKKGLKINAKTQILPNNTKVKHIHTVLNTKYFVPLTSLVVGNFDLKNEKKKITNNSTPEKKINKFFL